MRIWTSAFFLLVSPTLLYAEETFVRIQRVSGNQVTIILDAGNEDGGVTRVGGRRGGAATPGQQAFDGGRRGRSATTQPTILTVPPATKITSAMRERRTFEFRVGAELAGGLKHRVFQEMKTPLLARIVTDGDQITEINVIISETDINQSATTTSGEAIIAVRPKRPPMKRLSAVGESK
ncbi:MAG: hypothetical protein JNL67_14195 [Planctomycetaceae bacterium]|nr:hypothetical protein [Planctomycetaceae bacterium]